MKFVIRLFFKTLRLALAPVMMLWELLTRPKGVARQPIAQAEVDAQCRSFALYEYKSCPFCMKVRQEMRRLSLNIDRLDAQHDASHREALVSGGGKAKVPCLKITDSSGKSEWLYESGEIVTFLRRQFAA